MLKLTSWQSVLNKNCTKSAFDNFFEKINAARDISFPEIKYKQRPARFKHSPWMTDGLLVSNLQKEKLFTKKVKNPKKYNIESFPIYNRIYSKLRRAAKKMYYNNKFVKFSKNIKQTWSVIREVIGTNKQRDQIPQFFISNGQFINDYLK